MPGVYGADICLQGRRHRAKIGDWEHSRREGSLDVKAQCLGLGLKKGIKKAPYYWGFVENIVPIAIGRTDDLFPESIRGKQAL